MKEEIDTIIGNNLITKDVMGSTSKKAKEWYFNILNNGE